MDLFDEIKGKAVFEGQFAIAYAILRLAKSIEYLGTSNAATDMGAIEYLATKVGDVAKAIETL